MTVFELTEDEEFMVKQVINHQVERLAVPGIFRVYRDTKNRVVIERTTMKPYVRPVD